jgi:SAM-dependent MidA family methyltransferase
VTQAAFLLSLGFAQRAQMLKRKASPEQAKAIDAAFVRLTDCSKPTRMGELFKAMAITQQNMQFVPGFAD